MTVLTREEGRSLLAKKKRASVVLPWPAKELSPNARVHWSTKARATKSARRVAAWEATANRSFDQLKGMPLTVTVTFTPPDARRRDRDNMLASCKAYFDGIADVVGDDSNWSLVIRREPPLAPGSVCIEVEAAQ